MTSAHANEATNVQRKRPFGARKRMLSARANFEPNQAVERNPAEVEPDLKEIFSRTPPPKNKGGAPRGNKNRLVHGNYACDRREFYAQMTAYVRECREVVEIAKLLAALRDGGAGNPMDLAERLFARVGRTDKEGLAGFPFKELRYLLAEHRRRRDGRDESDGWMLPSISSILSEVDVLLAR
jgi:hypothetical protein